MLGKLPPVAEGRRPARRQRARADRRRLRDAAPRRPAHDPGDRPLAAATRGAGRHQPARGGLVERDGQLLLAHPHALDRDLAADRAPGLCRAAADDRAPAAADHRERGRVPRAARGRRARRCRRPRAATRSAWSRPSCAGCSKACGRRWRRRPGSPRSAARSARSTTICATFWPTRCCCPTGSSRARTPRCATSRRAWSNRWTARRGCAPRR